jgi:hypothetical protein
MKMLIGALLGAAAMVAMPAMAQDLTEEQQITATEFAINNASFVIQHEIAHLLVGELGLPVLGKEEDAADSLATLMLLGADDEASDQALMDSANGWYLMEMDAGDEFETADFYDEHSLSIQRAFQVVCLSVGAKPEVFAATADEYEMDAERQESCSFDYESAANAWATLLDPHAGDGTSGGKVEISYESGGEDYGDIEQLLKDAQFLEAAAGSISESYKLPRDVTLKAALCDEENAYYSYEEAGITFCYEMVGLFFRLIEQDLLANP